MALRRIVTGHNESGKSVVLFDGEPPSQMGPMIEIWATDETPASIRATRTRRSARSAWTRRPTARSGGTSSFLRRRG